MPNLDEQSGLFQTKGQPTISKQKMVFQIEDELTWVDLIRKYFENGEEPKDKKQCKKLRMQDARYTKIV